ncbi:MAG: YbjQ family protein [Candidatus Diapherotrites archaeon]|nr:YbjQ family protein [Candidatus Diapherotrites archaeon]
MLVCTTEEVPGYKVSEYLGMVWGTSVQARFIGQDLIAALKIVVGGEVWPYTKMMNEAKHYVIRRMVNNAKQLNADAIIGVRMESGQIVPGTTEIFAYGTAVKLKKGSK